MKVKSLISPAYAAQNRAMHEAILGYGTSGYQADARAILALVRKYRCQTVLDFGSRKGVRAQSLRDLGLPVYEFDPAFPGKDQLPAQADCVIAMDVMEHIEPDYIDAVIKAISDVKPKVFCASICLVPAAKTLPDGRNAHILQRTPLWWRNRVSRRFRVVESTPIHDEGRLTHEVIIAVPK